jgi:site-specific recombinase XerC
LILLLRNLIFKGVSFPNEASTFATCYLEANPDDLRRLAALVGHANLNTVMIYTEPRLDNLAERVERVESGN